MQFESVKILAVNGNDTTVEFTFDDGTKSTQTLAGLPLYNPELTGEELASAKAVLKERLVDYANAYIAGKAVEAQIDAPDLTGLTL